MTRVNSFQLIPSIKCDIRLCSSLRSFASDDDSSRTTRDDAATPSLLLQRRSLLLSSIALLPILPFTSFPCEAATSPPPPLPTMADVSMKLRRIPVFAVVDSSGKPYMVVSGDGRVPTGYFYTSYQFAQSVLDDAVAATKKDNSDDWVGARVAAVPLDFALKLQSRHPKSKAQTGQMVDTVYDILPAEADIEDALTTGSKIYRERGRVPLFYVDDFDLDNLGPNNKIPVYVHKGDLLKAYYSKNAEDNNTNNNTAPPTIKTVELIETFSAMMRDRANPLFQSLLFVPPSDSILSVKQCERARGDNTAYKTDEMVLVRGR